MVSEIISGAPKIEVSGFPNESVFEDPRFKAVKSDEIGSNSLLNRGIIDVFVHHPRTGQVWDITRFVDGISISEDYQTPFAIIELSLINTPNIVHYVQAGMWLTLFGPYLPTTGEKKSAYQEMYRGQIVTINAIMGDDKRVAVMAKDPAWLLAKNKIPYRLPEANMTDRLRFMETRGYITLAPDLINTDYILPATRGGHESIWEDIMFDLGETNRVEGKKYVLRHRKGKFSLLDTSQQVRMWSFEVGGNVLNATKQMSIENFYNIVYVIGEEDSGLEEFGLESTSIQLNVTATAVDQNSLTYMGQHILLVKEQLTTTTPDAQTQADELLEEYNKVEEVFTISTFSIPGVHWGDKVIVYDPVFDIAGIFYVLSVQHQITNGSALMTLTVRYDSPAPDEIRQVSLDEIATLLGVDATTLEGIDEEFEAE